MKIHSLELLNLNSLYGRWKIDFDAREYKNEGIFLICGETGAGKTTILDAICLALYGQTPRLGIISQNSEIMSHNTAECYARLIFSVDGRRYKSSWSQRIVNGKLNSAEHEIAVLQNGDFNALTDKKTDTLRYVQNDLLQMNFAAFTKSVMLAQGDFAAFLKAKPVDRVAILEKLTDTNIYRAISKKVYEKAEGQKKEIDALKNSLDDERLLTEAELQALRDKKSELEATLLQYKEEIRNINTALDWVKTDDALNAKFLEYKEEIQHLEKEKEEFEPKNKSILNAQKANLLGADYDNMCSLRKEAADKKVFIDTLGGNVIKLKEVLQLVTVKLDVAKNNCESVKKEYQSILNTHKKVREMDVNIKNGTQIYSEYSKEACSSQKKIDEYEESIAKLSKEIYEVDEDLQKCRQNLFKNKDDERLPEILARAEEKFLQMEESLKSYKEKEDTIVAVEKEYVRQSSDYEILKSNAGVLQANLQHIEDNQADLENDIGNMLNGRTIEDCEAVKKELEEEQNKIKLSLSYAQARKHLHSGEPCPLCGATTHPYADTQIPDKSELDEKINALSGFIQKVKVMQKELNVLKEEHNSVNLKIITAKAGLNAAKTALDMVDRDIKQQTEANKELQKSIGNKRMELLEMLSVWNVQNLSMQEIARLKMRSNLYKEFSDSFEKISKELVVKKNEILITENLKDSEFKRYSELTQRLNQELTQLQTLKAERAELYADKNPDEEEEKVKLRQEAADKVLAEQTAAHNNIDKELSSKQELLAANQEDYSIKLAEFQKKEIGFLIKLQKSSFDSEESLLNARMSDDVLEKLLNEAQELERKLSVSFKNIENKSKELAEHEKKRPCSVLSAEELNFARENLEKREAEANQSIGAINTEISSDIEAKQKMEGKNARLAELESVYKLWQELNSLVGSAKGDGYVKKVQVISFKTLIDHANSHLKKIDDRYQLKQSGKDNLELSVIDSYQADAIRQIGTLSGGETFIVSLALALGLTSMTGSKVQLDSLFLDEGFGSLDSDSLDRAMSALSTLRDEGKLIGIISHVNVLKESVSTQISVEKLTGGRSRVSGAGVTGAIKKAEY